MFVLDDGWFGHRDESLALSVRPLIDKFGGAVSNGVVGQIAWQNKLNTKVHYLGKYDVRLQIMFE